MPAKIKRYELLNKTLSAIVINSINAVLRPPGQVSGKVIIPESDLDNPEVRFLIEQNLVEVMEVEHKDRLPVKKSSPKQPSTPTEIDEQETKGTVVVMQDGVPYRRKMSKDATLFEGAPPPSQPPKVVDASDQTELAPDGFQAEVIDPDATPE